VASANRFAAQRMPSNKVAAEDNRFPAFALETGICLEASPTHKDSGSTMYDGPRRAPEDPDLLLRVGSAESRLRTGEPSEEILRK